MNRIHGECILHLLFFVLLILTIPPFISSYSTFWSSECTPSSSNTSTAAFKRNLDLLLQSLSTTAVAASGFSNNTVGEAPDRVFGLGICWAGSDAASCRSCLAAAATNFSAQGSELCAAAAIWYDGCLLRYSTEPFFAAVDTNWSWMVTADGYNATEPGRFNETVAELMWRLMSEAAAAPERFAVGKAGNRSFDWVYGALQCTGDLSTGDCYRCLNTYLSVLPVCCFAIRGASIYGKNCYLRYETYPFFNESLLQLPQRFNPPQVEGCAGTKNISGTSIIIMVVAFGASTFFLILLIASVCLWRRRTALRITSNFRCSESRLYDFNSLAIATDNFSDTNKLGEGGFGVVYKGRLPDGEEIAVKRLVKFIGRGVESIQNEMMVLARLEHRNLVRLLGSCIQEQEKLLVYEYMPNKSLDTFIFANDPTKRKEMGWKRRFDIIKGISRGLQYLHEESRIRVIHRDLKASNILLDENMNPKISDFGLARLFDNDRTHEATSNVAGTFGYMAPEYVRHGTFSTKSDVFSFGVLLLEIITGRRNASLGDSEFAFDLVLYLRQNWDEGKALGLEDPVLGEECPEEEVGRCIHVGLLCVQEDPSDRPSMEEVNLMLSSFAMAVPPLLRPVGTPDASWAAKTSTVSHLNSITD